MVNSTSKQLRKVCIAGISLLAIFSFIVMLGQFSDWTRVIPGVVTLLVLATLVAFVGLAQSLQVQPSGHKRLLFIIVSIALGLRGAAIFTVPILEVDYYRYLWDGKVLAKGISPYAYSPAQVLLADNANTRDDYQQAVFMSIESDSNYTILQRVHFPEYTTIYPPVSQLVFASAMKWFPAHASVSAHVTFMKFVLLIFDVLTLGLLLKLLARRGHSPGWSIAYAWNPLVIKEVANTGHLDSIAVFFLVAAVYFAATWLSKSADSRKTWPLWTCGLSLALGFGAKLFPVILLPLFVVGFAKVRWASALVFLIAFAIPAGGICWVMAQSMGDREHEQQHFAAKPDQQSKEGLAGFLGSWRMNDVIFSGIYRNLKPSSDTVDHEPWYVLLKNDHRTGFDQWLRQKSIGGANPAFAVSRLITLAVFGFFYAFMLYKTYRSEHSLAIENYVWVLTVFLFLQPTVNPWYWLWVAPLTCFANHKGWMFVSGLLMIYYLRFWFRGLPDSYSFGGGAYHGAGLFDHGVAWLEFAAIVAVILWIRLTRSESPEQIAHSE